MHFFRVINIGTCEKKIKNNPKYFRILQHPQWIPNNLGYMNYIQCYCLKFVESESLVPDKWNSPQNQNPMDPMDRMG